jgi:DNA-binding PadR family transcriptional regulator
MSGTNILGGFENLLLLAILRLGDRAYGVTIRLELLDSAGRDVAVGAIYTGLDRLQQKDSWSRNGEPTRERGGRAKKFYRVTSGGKQALKETHRALRQLAAGLEEFTLCLKFKPLQLSRWECSVSLQLDLTFRRSSGT